MGSEVPIDAEKLKKNCEYFAGSHRGAVDVLRKANGKEDYKKIAKDLGLPETKVSGLLKSAERLGLATKSGNLYKKRPGILQYMPPKKTAKKVVTATISTLIKASTKKRPRLPTGDSHKKNKFKDKSTEKMANAYLWLYLTENTIRDLIRFVFKEEADWWNIRVNKGIRENVEEEKKKYPYHGAERKDGLEFTHLGQLKEIICAKKNWKLFQPHLHEDNKNAFGYTIDKAIPSRNSIAHCTPLNSSDLKIVEVRFNDILKMIKST